MADNNYNNLTYVNQIGIINLIDCSILHINTYDFSAMEIVAGFIYLIGGI
jgi:hypothetical protein